jgi:hypothetical protein
MKTITSLLTVGALMALYSCSNQPKSCFKVELQKKDGKWIQASEGKVGDHFYFSPMCSENIFALGTEFDYGDGTKGTQESHEYAKPGQYTVKCTVYNTRKGEKGDVSDVATQTIVVKQLSAEAKEVE